jgi:hypothetical protein
MQSSITANDTGGCDVTDVLLSRIVYGIYVGYPCTKLRYIKSKFMILRVCCGDRASLYNIKNFEI